MTPAQREIIEELQKFAQSAPTAEALMDRMAKRLHEKMTRYNWAGFYLVDPADSNYLVVGPFAGSFTPNQKISVAGGALRRGGDEWKSGGGAGRDEGCVVPCRFVDGEVGDCGADFCEPAIGGAIGYRELFRGYLYAD